MRQPFLIGFQQAEKDGAPIKEMVISVDMDSPRVSTTEGEPVFLEHGGNTGYLDQVNSILNLIREGKAVGQAVGYLDDGTMLVVEDGKNSIGKSTVVEATSILTTNNGRMVFAKMKQGEETA